MPIPAYSAHSKALIDDGAQVGAHTRVWAFAHIMPGAKVGQHCNLCDYVFIETGAILGNHVTVKNGVQLWNGVVVEDSVFLGPNCVFTNDRVPRTTAVVKRREADWLARTHLKKGASVGANATIVCGITIGQYALIAAGSVVTKDVPDHALVMGNPARFAAWICRCGTKLKFKSKNVKCAECGTAYVKGGSPAQIKAV